MAMLLWDASALVKRYAAETGSDVVNALFSSVPRTRMVTTVLSYAEAASVLVRKRNRGDLREVPFRAAISSLQSEIITDPEFGMLAVEFDDVVAGVELVLRHSINSADAAILASFLGFCHENPRMSCLLVATDQRLIRAAEAEGLSTLNPENFTPSEALARATVD